MSVEDDQDFCKKLVEQTSTIIAKEIAKVTKQITVERKEREKLEARVKEMETELATARGDRATLQGEIQALQYQQVGCTCKNDLFKAFSAALVAVTPMETGVQEYGTAVGTDFVQLMNQYPAADSVPSYEVSQVIDTPLQSTPVTATATVRSSPAATATLRSTPVTSGASKKRRRIEATSQYITDIELVSQNLKVKIQPYYKPNPMASQDLMNDVQRAFIKFKAENVHKSGESITAGFIQSIIHEGTEERLWTADFNPRGSSGSFEDYLTDRIKNERKVLRRADELSNQQKQVEHILDETLKED